MATVYIYPHTAAMPHYAWLYVLASDNHRFHTVGASSDLVRTFEHMDARVHPDYARNLVGVYRIELLAQEFEEMGLKHPRVRQAEENLALQIMKREGSGWCRVQSCLGRFEARSEVPEKLAKTHVPVLCQCGVPAERRVGRTGLAYYACTRKNRDWLQRMRFPDFIRSVAGRACEFYAHASFYEGAPKPKESTTPEVAEMRKKQEGAAN